MVNTNNEIKKFSSSTWTAVGDPARANEVGVGGDGSVYIISNTMEAWIGYSIMKLEGDTFETLYGAPSNPYKVDGDAYGDCWVLTHKGELYVQRDHDWIMITSDAIAFSPSFNSMWYLNAYGEPHELNNFNESIFLKNAE